MSFSTVLKYGILSQSGAVIPPSFPSSGLTAYWRFDEEGSTVVYDALGGINGTANNSDMAGNSGMSYNCQQYQSPYRITTFSASDTGDVTFTGSSTISCWVYPTGDNGADGSLIIHNGNFPYNYRLDYTAYKFGFAAGLGGSFTVINTTDTFSLNEWYHVVLTYDSSAGQKIYVNGVEKASGSTTGTRTLDSTNYGLHFGTYYGNPTRYEYYGYLDEMAMWNRCLTPTEIDALYNSGAGLFYPIPTWELPVTSGLTAWFGNNVANVYRTVLSNATTITQWDDMATTANTHTLLLSAGTPTYNATENAIETGSGVYMATNAESMMAGDRTARTFFMVHQENEVASYNYFWSFDVGGSTGTDLYMGTDYGRYTYYYGASAAYNKWNPKIAVDTKYLYTNYKESGGDRDDENVRVDGVAGSIYGSSGSVIGSTGTGHDRMNSALRDGLMHEFIYYNRVLSTSEIEEVEDYLAGKYLWNNLTSYWSFETTGSTISDTKGSRDLTTVTNVDWNDASIRGIGADCTSLSTVLTTDDDEWLNADVVSGSISVWFNCTGTTNDKFLFSGEGWFAIAINSSTGYLAAQSDGGTYDCVGTTNVCDGNWHNAIYTWDANDGIIYLDGVEEATQSMANSPTPESSSNRGTGVGCNWNGAHYYNGTIDEVGVWSNRRLSLVDAKALYNAGNGRFYDE